MKVGAYVVRCGQNLPPIAKTGASEAHRFAHNRDQPSALLHSPERAFHVSSAVDHSVSDNPSACRAERRVHQNGGWPYLCVEQIVNELRVYAVGFESKNPVEEHAAARAYLVAHHVSADSARPDGKAPGSR